MPFGAEIGSGGVRFRLWAPAATSVDLEILADGAAAGDVGTTDRDGVRSLAMRAGDRGWFELVTASARAGSRYRFVIDGGDRVPDPASRYQPLGVHGPSEVVEPAEHVWSDVAYRPRPWHELVFYELHVGAFTPAGTYRAAIERFDDLVSLGVTALEVMPLAEAPGTRNWGYDGVFPYAPESAYGEPADFKAFVEAAHVRGLAVFVDVVYNHFGPEGNLLHRYAPQFFTDRHHTPWGSAIDFSAREVREFFIHNALYWAQEYGVDGLRLDAVHAIADDSQPPVLVELAERFARGGRATSDGRAYAVLENDANATHLLFAYAAQWDDDVHHALHVLATGERDGYYVDYCEAPARLLARALCEGFAYQGEPSPFRGGTLRGQPSHALPPASFVTFLQNHDQIGNRALGERIGALAERAAVRAAAAIVLLAPSPPLLFMGEEWAASTPFLFFCDFEPALAQRVRDGRRREFAAFAAFTDPAVRARIPDPGTPSTFERSKLDWAERDDPEHREMLGLYRDALRLRHDMVIPLLARERSAAEWSWDPQAPRAFRVRWTFDDTSLAVVAQLDGVAVAPAWLAEPERGSHLFAVRGDDGAADPGTIGPWTVQWTVDP